MTKNAIVSVYDKTGLDRLVPFLIQNNYNIYSTGGSFKKISDIIDTINNKSITRGSDNKINKSSVLIDISSYTNSPEICNGRVKTLHPKVFGGILAIQDNENHLSDLNSIGATTFDLVVVNLYPFEETLQNGGTEREVIEQIDIGGHTLIRAAIKNYKNVCVLTCPSQYENFIEKTNNNLFFAKQAIGHIMKYDITINNWFIDLELSNTNDNQSNDNKNLYYYGNYYNINKELKYGLNPYMKPAYIMNKNGRPCPFKILNGNPGYINLQDANNAFKLVMEVRRILGLNCCTSFKHTSPAGVSIESKINNLHLKLSDFGEGGTVFFNARNIDPKSSFGDFIAYNGNVDNEMASIIKKYVSDGMIALSYDDDALEILKSKKNGNYILLQQSDIISEMEYRDVNGITLVQPTNNEVIRPSEIKNELIKMQLGENYLSNEIINNIVIGFITLKYTQSNSVCFVYKGNVIGIGAGQQNRVDCVKLAGDKAMEWLSRCGIKKNEVEGLTLVSDAFFPFSDNIDVASEYGVRYISQPGGSIRDSDVEEACKKYGITMIYSGKRVFTH